MPQQYMLLLYDDPSEYRDMSPAEMQAMIERYSAWARSVGQQGKLKGNNKLRDEGGRIVRGVDGRVVVADGPYAEAKEIVSGYFLVEADSYDEAVDIARGCPHAQSRGKIEIREIEPLH